MPVNASWYQLDKYSNRVPVAISRKIALLHEQESRISALKNELEKLEINYSQLRKELEPYRISPEEESARSNIETGGTSQANSSTYIDRLPHDLLYIIFKKTYIEWDHSNIWQLLFVCRHWNQFIMNCPALWAQIGLDWGSGTPFGLSLERPLSYISACLERSRGLLLDMNLNFECFPGEEYISQTILTDTNGAIIDASNIENLINPSWGWDLNFDNPSYCWIFNRFFDHLTGIRGQHMSRWSRLRLDFGYGDPSSAGIWKRLRGPLPNLKTIHVEGFPQMENYDYDVSVFSQGLTDLSTVTSLKTLGTPLFTSFPLSNSNLRHLNTRFNEIPADLVPLSAFPRLQTLKLYGDDPELMDSPTDPPLTIRLPNLEELTLSGDYSLLSRLTWDLPMLKRLVIYTDGEDFMKPPDLSPECICWIASRWSGDKIEEVFDSLLALSWNIESITVSNTGGVRWMVLGEIGRRREKVSLMSLPRVYPTTWDMWRLLQVGSVDPTIWAS